MYASPAGAERCLRDLADNDLGQGTMLRGLVVVPEV